MRYARISYYAVLFLLLPLFIAGCATLEKNRYARQKAVYHIDFDSLDAQFKALRYIQNHIIAVGADNLDLKVVVMSDGLSLFLKPEAAEETSLSHGNAGKEIITKINVLRSQGAQFLICLNTVRGKKVEREKDLYGVGPEDLIPSGVAELAHLQKLGYAYIKP